MATITWALEADFDGDGSYETDLTQYVDMPGQNIRVGMGVGRDGKQQTTKLTFSLSNWDGTFTPENSASSLYGKLNPGVPIRLTATAASVTTTIGTMYAMQWKTSFRDSGPSVCQVSCEDIIWFLQRGDPVLITASASRDTTEALTAITDAVGLTAADLDFDDGLQDLPMHFAVLEKPVDALQAVAASEMGGQLYPNALGQLRFENRNARVGVSVLDATWGSGTDIVPFAEDYDLNPLESCTAVTVRATHFHSGQADTLIWADSFNMFTNPASSRALEPGEVYERVYQANSAFLVLTTPEAVKDYLANASQDGSGVDLTGSLSVTVTQLGSDLFRLRRENTGSTRLYVTKIQQRGQPVEFYSDQSIAQFSLSVPWLPAGISQEFDLPFTGDADGKFVDYAYQELRVGRYPWPVLKLQFKAVLDAQITALLAADLGQCIAYASPTSVAGDSALVDDSWRIEAIDYNAPSGWAGETFDCAVTLIPSDVYRNLDAIAYDLFDRADNTGANLLSDSGIESGVGEWFGYQSTRTQSAVQAHGGTNSMKILNAAGAGAVFNAYLARAGGRGDAIFGGGWVYGEGASVGQTLYVIARESPSFNQTITEVTLTAGWQRVDVGHVATDASTTELQLIFERFVGTAASEYFYVDDVEFYDGPGLGRSTQGATWANDAGFRIVDGVACAVSDSLSQPEILVGASDQCVEVILANIGAGDEPGVTFRRTSDDNEYRAYLKQASNLLVVERVVGGVVETLASVAFTVGTSHELRVIHQLDRIRVWLDGRRYVSVRDSGIGSGLKAGLFARNASGTTTFAHYYAQGLNVEPEAGEAVMAPHGRLRELLPFSLRRRRVA